MKRVPTFFRVTLVPIRSLRERGERYFGALAHSGATKALGPADVTLDVAVALESIGRPGIDARRDFVKSSDAILKINSITVHKSKSQFLPVELARNFCPPYQKPRKPHGIPIGVKRFLLSEEFPPRIFRVPRVAGFSHETLQGCLLTLLLPDFRGILPTYISVKIRGFSQ